MERSVTGNGSYQFAVTYGEGQNVMNQHNPTVFREAVVPIKISSMTENKSLVMCHKLGPASNGLK